MRQRFFNLLLRVYGFLVRIVYGDVLGVFIFFDILFYFFCKLYIAAVTGRLAMIWPLIG